MEVTLIKIKQIKPGPYQCRDDISPESITELSKSIAADGVINPLLVRPAGKGYEIVCGHRRFAALKHLKEDEAPCRIKEMTDREACRASLAENLAREDLSPLERTEGISEWVDAYMEEHCDGYLDFLKTKSAEIEAKIKSGSKEGRRYRADMDVATVKGRVCLITTLVHSDRRNGTQLVTNSMVSNLDEAFASLPRPIHVTTFAVKDLPVLMNLEGAPEIREFAKAHKLNKAKVIALLDLKVRAKTEPKHAKRLKEILETGQVDDQTSWGDPTGVKFDIASNKIKAKHINPPKPKNPGRGVRNYKAGEKPCNGGIIADHVIAQIEEIDPRDLQFDTAMEKIMAKVEEMKKLHVLITTD